MGKRVEGKALYAASICRNKEMISVNLRTEEGRAVIRSLVAKCDVLVENFRPGTLERWGLGYDDLTAINPGLVMVRISGFGQSGPYSARAGYGLIGDAMSGMRHITGDPDRPPTRVRSEEHTSELQSLMRISYAVFCLKKKNNETRDTKPNIHQKEREYKLNNHSKEASTI